MQCTRVGTALPSVVAVPVGAIIMYYNYVISWCNIPYYILLYNIILYYIILYYIILYYYIMIYIYIYIYVYVHIYPAIARGWGRLRRHRHRQHRRAGRPARVSYIYIYMYIYHIYIYIYVTSYHITLYYSILYYIIMLYYSILCYVILSSRASVHTPGGPAAAYDCSPRRDGGLYIYIYIYISTIVTCKYYSIDNHYSNKKPLYYDLFYCISFGSGLKAGCKVDVRGGESLGAKGTYQSICLKGS